MLLWTLIFQNVELRTRTFTQVIELCFNDLIFQILYVTPIRGETIDNEIEISSEHVKVYINLIFLKKVWNYFWKE